ncbi:D-2-hydroxyacid dehydrogenase [Cohnella abietis]|uniref:2-hydroxyacid dehydrogenase n=1 Tax=Cohnella abietis TaxID=2507935 RepID=A0A3T1D3D9_9BACL|nr:D-2-hydroxyacid dehydrogenase [Cohnella abietis]BBI32623.1 2-hydroxyacid dehydrogenase [Cohnella abietis]
MPSLLLLFELKAVQVQQIQELIPDWTIVTGSPDQISHEQYLEAEVVCGWNATMGKILETEGSKLKWVQTSSAGVDKLPLDRLKSLGIQLSSASGIHPASMTETLFAMLLSFSRNLHHAIRHQSQQQWQPSERYHLLSGKTMGIIGVGAIGEEFARIAVAFGMRTIGVRRSSLPSSNVEKMYGIDQLKEVLSQSDVVVNVLPYTEETHHLFDKERLGWIRPGALFFNMGRGPSVDTDALIQALENGSLAGAGLDVFETEPLPADHPLWKLDNVIITPHIGGWTDNYKQRVADILMDNLKAYLAVGKPERNVVNLERSY